MYLFPFTSELTKRRSWWKPLLQKILSDWMVRSKKASFSSTLWNPPILASYLGPSPQSVSNDYTPHPALTLQAGSFLHCFSGAFDTNCGARVCADIQNSAPCPPPVGLAWWWKHGPQKGTHKGRQASNAGAICQFSLGSFQELKEAEAGAEKGGLQGRAEKKSFTGKAIAIWKEAKKVWSLDGWCMGSPDPPPELSRDPLAPSLVGLLWAAEHFKCYSQNPLSREDLIYMNHKKTPCRGVFWLPPWKAQATCLCKDYVGVSFFR